MAITAVDWQEMLESYEAELNRLQEQLKIFTNPTVFTRPNETKAAMEQYTRDQIAAAEDTIKAIMTQLA